MLSTTTIDGLDDQAAVVVVMRRSSQHYCEKDDRVGAASDVTSGGE